MSPPRSLIPISRHDLTLWRSLDECALEPTVRTKYRARRLAVQMYADGSPFDEIQERTSISKQSTLRFVKRCLVADGAGDIWGFRALAPGQRVKKYERTAPVDRALGDGSGGCAGALTQLFGRFPEVERYVCNRFFGKPSRDVPDARISYMQLHGEFLDQLRAFGFGNEHWPFNTSNCGYKALRAYCHDLIAKFPDQWVRARYGAEAAHRSSVGTGYATVLPKLRGFGACQLDFHMVDSASVVIFEPDEGGRIAVPLRRWYVGFLIEERWGLILGAFCALESNASSDSVLEVVESALKPIDPASGTACMLTMNGKVFPNQIMPELAYQGFSVLKMDNAWSNAATEVVDNIIQTVGCAINFGPVRAWWRRHPIESIFGKLTKRGLQRLPSTFGTGPNDTRRSDPVYNATKFEITAFDLSEIINGCIYEHNSSSNEGIDFASPIGALQHSLSLPERGVFLQPLPKASQRSLKLLSHMEVVKVRGSAKKGVRPYVKLGRWRYTNPELASAYDLIDRELLVYCDRRDARIVLATVRDTGEELGALRPPTGRRNQYISFRNRALINQAGLSDRLRQNSGAPVKLWQELKAKALRASAKGGGRQKQNSTAALQFAKITEDRKRHNNIGASEPSPNTVLNNTKEIKSAIQFDAGLDVPMAFRGAE